MNTENSRIVMISKGTEEIRYQMERAGRFNLGTVYKEMQARL